MMWFVAVCHQFWQVWILIEKRIARWSNCCNTLKPHSVYIAVKWWHSLKISEYVSRLPYNDKLVWYCIAGYFSGVCILATSATRKCKSTFTVSCIIVENSGIERIWFVVARILSMYIMDIPSLSNFLF